MARVVGRSNITSERPSPGGIIQVEAEWPVSQKELTDVVSAFVIRSALEVGMPAVRAAVGRSMGRAWRSSGLTRRTGRLIAQALRNFTVRLRLRSEALAVIVVWNDPSIPHFFAQLFGRPEVNLRSHDFIIFDNTAADEIREIFNGILDNLLRGEREKRKQQAAKERKTAGSLSGFRQSYFRAKRELRKKGVSPERAKTFVRSQLGGGTPLPDIFKMIESGEIVGKLRRGQPIKIRRGGS